MALPLATIAAYSAAMLSTLQDSSISITMAGMYAGSFYAALLWPTLGVLNESKTPLQESPDHTFNIPITKAQLNAVKDFASRNKRNVYSLSVMNCASFTKRMMQACGIKIPMRFLFNTPAYMVKALKKLENMLDSPKTKPDNTRRASAALSLS